MKILVGEYEVFKSGSLYNPSLSDTKFVLSEQPEMNVIFKVLLDGKSSEVTLESVDNNSIAMVVSNPDGVGFGTSKPVKVGFLNGKELYVSFFVTVKSNKDSYSLDYTFFLKEVNNG